MTGAVWCYHGLATAAVRRVGIPPADPNFDDLRQEAAVAALVAARSHRPGRGASEASWASWAAQSAAKRKRREWRAAASALVHNDDQADEAGTPHGRVGEWADPTGDAATDRAAVDEALRRLERESSGLPHMLAGFAAGLTHAEIAAVAGVTPSRVTQRLRPFFAGQRNGSSSRAAPPRLPAELRDEARRLRAEGASYRAIAGLVGVTVSTVHAWCTPYYPRERP